MTDTEGVVPGQEEAPAARGEDADKAEDEAREPSATRTPQPVEPAPAPAPAAPQPVEESTVAASQADTEARPSGQCRPPWC